jgi:hypothetical protein
MLENAAAFPKLEGVIPGAQGELNFDSNQSEEGYNQWREHRWQAMRELSRKMGLPLERKVEVWLRGEIRLIGILHLYEDLLFVTEDQKLQLELIVDNVRFAPEEMISCVAVNS